MRKGGAEKRFGVGLGGAVGMSEHIFRKFFNGCRRRATPVVAQQVGGDAKEVAACGHIPFSRSRMGCAEEADEAFLHEIVGQCGISRDTGQVSPERTGCTFVEGGEGVAIHADAGKRAVAGRVRRQTDKQFAGE